MTPTSDERLEVASALRGDPNDTLIPQSRDGFEGMTYREAAYRFWDMCRRVRDAANVDIAYSTTSVLADLIDPSCKVSSVETYCNELGQLEGWEFHLTCGHSFQRPWNEPPAYCPECGARVVSGDAQ